MKRNGQLPDGVAAGGIPAVPYRPSPGRPPGLEILDLPGLAAQGRERDLPLSASARPAFHLIVAVRDGQLECSVDFTSYSLGAGDWLWVWPGQVLRFPDGPGDGDATVLVFPTGFPTAATDVLIRDGEHVACRLIRTDPPRRAALSRILDSLTEEYGCLGDLKLEAHIEALRDLLSVILIRLVHLAGPRHGTRSDSREPFERFRQAVEEGFRDTHRVEDYAVRLGYSARTLTRATRAALGCGAKRYIDDRVMLEAKRLLIHTSLPPAAIGESIGFTHPTAFSAFFRQHTGMTPTGFRSLT
ncbi:helix-turn-helix domain-containing protein [Streptomyces atroolivaceus]|uniref:helix-turn-helix domain-containing protein n=1 Tax=Streptomyces atroolivaceus TaxID=66869 RepID=UPI003638635C